MIDFIANKKKGYLIIRQPNIILHSFANCENSVFEKGKYYFNHPKNSRVRYGKKYLKFVTFRLLSKISQKIEKFQTDYKK